jgi:hypothetical protein
MNLPAFSLGHRISTLPNAGRMSKLRLPWDSMTTGLSYIMSEPLMLPHSQIVAVSVANNINNTYIGNMDPLAIISYCQEAILYYPI